MKTDILNTTIPISHAIFYEEPPLTLHVKSIQTNSIIKQRHQPIGIIMDPSLKGRSTQMLKATPNKLSRCKHNKINLDFQSYCRKMNVKLSNKVNKEFTIWGYLQ